MTGIASLAIRFAELVPGYYIYIGAVAVLIVVIGGLLYKRSWWRSRSLPSELMAKTSELPLGVKFSIFLRTLGREALATVPLYRTSKGRWAAHLLIFIGFLGLIVTTISAYIVNPTSEPLPFTHGVNLLGWTMGIIVLVGLLISGLRRISIAQERTRTSKAEAGFMAILAATVLTGLGASGFRFMNLPEMAYGTYITHLLLVIVLLGLAPFLAFVHAVETPYLTLFDNYKAELVKQGVLPKTYKEEVSLRYAATTFYPLSKEEAEKPG